MKKIVVLLSLAALATSAVADEVAVMQIQSGEKIQRVVIEFYEEAAPLTVANFKKLASKRFYNGTAFHRVFPLQMIQGGDPLSKNKNATGIGTGGPGYTLPAEIGRKHLAGTVAAARLPDKINPARVSNGSQFYITLTPMPQLDGQYTVFGHVIEGLDALNAISKLRTDTNDSPLERVVIQGVHIVSRETAQTGGNWFQRVYYRHF